MFIYICHYLTSSTITTLKNEQRKLGRAIRRHRERKNMLLRQLASQLDMDTAQLSKIENGQRQFKREHIHILALALDTDETELQTLWLADQVMDIVQDEPAACTALKTVLKQIKNS